MAPNCSAFALVNTTVVDGPCAFASPASYAVRAPSLLLRPGASLSSANASISIQLFDALNRSITSWPTLSASAAVVSASGAVPLSSVLTGAAAATYAAGAAVFAETTLSAPPGTNVSLSLALSAPAIGPPLDGALAQLGFTIGACALFDPLSVYSNVSSSCVCAKGGFFNASSGDCQLCPPGTNSPTEGALSCLTNVAGTVTVTPTVVSSTLTLAGVTAFGASQNASLALSIARSLNTTASAVAITSVTLSSRRLLTASLAAAFSVTTTADASGLTAAIGAPAAFAATLATNLAGSGDAVLASLPASALSVAAPTVVVMPPEVAQCPAGTHLDSDSQTCMPCEPGTYAFAPGASVCSPCTPDTYSQEEGATSCALCPLTSVAPVGSLSLLNCSCQYGFYAVYDNAEEPTQFVCTPCPDGALCVGPASPSGPTAPPTALAGYWHEVDDSTAFYSCLDGMCLDETLEVAVMGGLDEEACLEEIEASGGNTTCGNCRVGHLGPVCGSCWPGWTPISGFCQACKPGDNINTWSGPARNGLLSAIVIVFVSALATFLLLPLFPNASVAEAAKNMRRFTARIGVTAATDGGAEEAASAKPLVLGMGVRLKTMDEAPPSHYSARFPRLALVLAMISFFAEPATLLIEQLQILSSFKRTLLVPWPNIFRSTMSRLVRPTCVRRARAAAD